MDDLLAFLLFIVLMAVMGLSYKYLPSKRLGRRSSDVRDQIEDAFAEHLFKLLHGRVPGARLILIAKLPAPTTERRGEILPGDEGSGPTWYCIGPGPGYLVARAVYLMEWHGARIEFAIRVLDAAEFRQELEGRPAALSVLDAVEQAMGQATIA